VQDRLLAARQVRAPGASLVAYQHMRIMGHVDSYGPQASDKPWISFRHAALISARCAHPA